MKQQQQQQQQQQQHQQHKDTQHNTNITTDPVFPNARAVVLQPILQPAVLQPTPTPLGPEGIGEQKA
jgi:hypothetical protein